MPDLLNDRYQLGQVVGSGGMGSVHRAIDTRLGRTVAVKILRAGSSADDTARSRMRSEAKLAASIHHPGVAQVFDFATDAPAGPTYLVMQFVDGHTLAQLLREQGPMPCEQVMAMIVQVAEGLQACHEAGIVHRDLKPANIMLTPAGRTVLVDFGIARSETSEPLTETGALIGTADYMSPEQAAGRPATPQSDLYALGVVAHHCLTGTSPFRRESVIATALAHLNDDLPALDPQVPAAAATLIRQLTSKSPAMRPESAAAVARQAAAVGAPAAIDLPATFEQPAHSAPVGPLAVSSATALTAHAPTPSAIPRRRRPTAAFAGVGVLAVALALLGVQSFQSDDTTVVPSVVGMNVDDARARIRDAGLTASTRRVDRADEAAGQVVGQSPAAGEPAPSSGPVRVSVASGKVLVSAKDVIGTTYAAASAALERLGLEVKRVEVQQSTKVGEVLALDKSGRLPTESTITLSVAVAPVAAPVQSPAQARSSGSVPSRTGSSSARPNSAKGPGGPPKQKPSGKGKPKTKGTGKGKK